MGSPEILNFEELLAPVSEDDPVGPDLREDFSPTSAYRQLKDARNSARTEERRLLMDGPESGANPNWRPIRDQAPKVLATRSKDLEVAAWLTEALVREYGFAGLRDGFRLMRELATAFWDTLHPRPNDEDGMLARTAPVIGLNGDEGEGTLVRPLFSIPLTDGDPPYAQWHYQQAVRLDGMDVEARDKRVKAGDVSMEMFELGVKTSSDESIQTILADLDAAIAEWDKLIQVMDEKAGEHAPPSSNIRGGLRDIREIFDLPVFKNKRADDVVEEPVVDGGDESAGESGEDGAAPSGKVRKGGGVAVGEITSREEAFRQIEKIAKYFRRNDPQSLVAYALEQAVRWGGMQLPDLLAELIPDDTPRLGLFKLVGIPAPKPESSGY